MHRRIVWQDSHHAPTDPHGPAELLVANDAVPLVAYGNVSVAPALSAGLIVAKVQSSRHGYALGLAQTGHHPRLVDKAGD